MAEDVCRRARRISVEQIDDNNREAATRLEVAEEHLPYVAPVAEMLEGCDGAIENYVIRAGFEVVGFFRLDFDLDRVSEYAGDGQNCGLRGYLIGRAHQGNGYGSAAIPAIRDLVIERHPDVTELVLTVNLRNVGAISAYKKAGFHDTSALYHGGASGPQHVFSLPLQRKPRKAKGAAKPLP